MENITRPTLSIIVPSDQERVTTQFQKTLNLIKNHPQIQVILVPKSAALTRAERLNIGFHQAQADMILFHHPRSALEIDAIKKLQEIKNKKIWGAFTHQFDREHWLLSWTSFYSNYIRGKRRGIFYLDHCIFFHRDLWKTDLPPIAIFEDTILSQNLKHHSKPVLFPQISQTSAVRFENNGVFKQAFMNQILKWGFWLGISNEAMNSWYEKNLKLNE